ncbi:hypothetical protein V9T40_000172 [Parthenolecanium corni]|uniref:Uncharacterized protein n=1 Tax=Parthenolecanium corni TaxID=536013 RepID=A0AAN9Y2N2_9HEMI
MCEQIKFTFDTSSYESRASLSSSPIGPSCLRSSERKKAGITRNVSFPDDDSQIVTGILEPENPWKSTSDITNDDLMSMYLSSCSKHGTFPIPEVLDQISEPDLKLKRIQIETKRINFVLDS